MKLILCLALIFLAGITSAEKFRFDNYKLVRFSPVKDDHLKMLRLFEGQESFDIWNGVNDLNSSVDVSMSPEAFAAYKPVFHRIQLPHQVIHENIQYLIEEQENSMRRVAKSSRIVGTYARYAQVMEFMENLEKDNPDLVSLYSAGTTFEERDIKVVKLATASGKKGIWIDCGIHAREWVSVSTCVYFINQMIVDYRGGKESVQNLLNNYEFHIMPIVNPDGYEYTFTGYRLWRKNRFPNYAVASSCIGTDVNRNFDYKWMFSGSSSYPCSDIYAGNAGGSELETQAVKKAIRDNEGNWESFVTLHSYGGYWMPPWAWGSETPEDYSVLEAYSNIACDAIKNVHGEVFKVGTPYMTLNYAASGGSYDWAKAITGIKYAFAVELRPSSTSPDNRYGFMLPESKAILAGEETYAGLVTLFEAIRQKSAE